MGRPEVARANQKIAPQHRRASVVMCAAVFVVSSPAHGETEPTMDVALRGGLVSSTNFDIAAGGLVEGMALGAWSAPAGGITKQRASR